jgi:hypothetical protein
MKTEARLTDNSCAEALPSRIRVKLPFQHDLTCITAGLAGAFPT